MTFEIPGTVPRDVVLDGKPQFFLSRQAGGIIFAESAGATEMPGQPLRSMAVLLTHRVNDPVVGVPVIEALTCGLFGLN